MARLPDIFLSYVLTSTWNPKTKAFTKSAALVRAPISWVSLHVWKGTHKTQLLRFWVVNKAHVFDGEPYFDLNIPSFEVKPNLQL